ncbi:MAG: phosphoribosylformylglycinamidine cyclo-ligase [Eubacteriales bacterium]
MLTYKDAGVDTQEGQRAVQLMKTHVEKTFSPNVLTGLGSFGGLYSLGKQFMEEPVLVAGTDGVGTKLKIAFQMDKHDTVGQDLVAMCVNDILCQGAMPLFFLDYIATGKVVAEEIAVLVSGIAKACEASGLSLIGGETAEMPDFYQPKEYDMAGFAVGMVDRKKIVDGSKVCEGDVVIGLSSSGVHSNGFSFVRKLFFQKMGYTVDSHIEELGMTLGESLLTPTKLYVKPVQAVLAEVEVHGMIHVTGGGFYENVPRILGDGLSITIEKSKITPLPIFEYIQKVGGIEERELYASFNMGIGFMIVVPESQGEKVLAILAEQGEQGRIIGEVTKNTEEKVVIL